MKEGTYHHKSISDIYKELKTSEKGLSQNEVAKRLDSYGKNEIVKKNKLRWLKVLFSQFNSFLIYILILSSIIMFLIGSNIDAIVILAIVLLNGGIGFFQQFKAEKAIANLKKLVVPKSLVIRDGKVTEISSIDLVPGDIILFEQGDKINADCRIIEENNLETNEAPLTGESLPIKKTTRVLGKKVLLAKRENMLFTGTQVVNGDAKAIVVSTGMQTVFGNIAETLQEIEEQKTPIQKRLDKFSKQLGLIIIGMVLIVLLIGVFHKFSLLEMFLTSVALAIGAIPEGLPAVIAIAFSISSIMMSKKNVVVRKLPAVESLGSVTVICSDKTGTITEEKMSVQKIFANGKSYSKEGKRILLGGKEVDLKKQFELNQLLRTSVLCNNSTYEVEGQHYKMIGDPTETALLSAALDLNVDKKSLVEEEKSKRKFDFDSKRKMMSVLRENGRTSTLYTKGAPENVLEKCNFELVKGNIQRMTQKRRDELMKSSRSMEEEALRVLGFAYKNFGKKEKVEERGLIFIGFSGMLDAPRKEVKDAVAHCKNAGIDVKIITGDSALTAKAVAAKIGIKGRIVGSEELDEMSDDELGANIKDIAIFARATPQQKLRITNMLQSKKEVVAITGDGINDVLALKAADIGIAMGQRGTDVSRDVSDIVLIDDNFASIVEGVKQGRKTYDNIKKFTKYLLTVNFSQIILIGALAMFGMPLPLLPLQILWINLITDSFPALTLVFEKEENVMRSKPRREKSLLSGIWGFIILGGIWKFFVALTIYLIAFNKGLGIDMVRTLVLTNAILYELLFVYVCRSDKPLSDIGIFSNKWLNIAIVTGIILQLVLIYTPLADAFSVVPMLAKDWLFILPFAVSGLVLFEIGKYVLKYKKGLSKKS